LIEEVKCIVNISFDNQHVILIFVILASSLQLQVHGLICQHTFRELHHKTMKDGYFQLSACTLFYTSLLASVIGVSSPRTLRIFLQDWAFCLFYLFYLFYFCYLFYLFYLFYLYKRGTGRHIIQRTSGHHNP